MSVRLAGNPLKIKSKLIKDKVCLNTRLSNIFIIRHAESHFNHAIDDLKSRRHLLNTEEYNQLNMKIRFGSELCDCPLTHKGINQCSEAAYLLNGVNLKYVFVSPLLRTLTTLEHLINGINKLGHKKFEGKVIVHPLIFEKLEDSCDIMPDIEKNMKNFSHFDWDLFRSIEHLPAYQLNYCTGGYSFLEVAKENYKNKNYYDHHNVILPEMLKMSLENKFIESSFTTFQRLSIFLKFLKKFIKESKIPEDEGILIVGHSVLFKHLTSIQINEIDSFPINSYVLKNCELANLSLSEEEI